MCACEIGQYLFTIRALFIGPCKNIAEAFGVTDARWKEPERRKQAPPRVTSRTVTIDHSIDLEEPNFPFVAVPRNGAWWHTHTRVDSFVCFPRRNVESGGSGEHVIAFKRNFSPRDKLRPLVISGTVKRDSILCDVPCYDSRMGAIKVRGTGTGKNYRNCFMGNGGGGGGVWLASRQIREIAVLVGGFGFVV